MAKGCPSEAALRNLICGGSSASLRPACWPGDSALSLRMTAGATAAWRESLWQAQVCPEASEGAGLAGIRNDLVRGAQRPLERATRASYAKGGDVAEAACSLETAARGHASSGAWRMGRNRTRPTESAAPCRWFRGPPGRDARRPPTPAAAPDRSAVATSRPPPTRTRRWSAAPVRHVSACSA